jgi:uncharacterized protein (DUF1697 family)
LALAVFLRGVNVGGHRTFRPSALARQLKHLDAVNIGGAGTFVIRRPAGRDQVRAEIARRLPFAAQITICEGQDIVRLVARGHVAAPPRSPGVVRFVSVLSRRPRSAPATPMNLPGRGRWLVEILARQDRFVLGVYRRHMQVIGLLGTLDRLFGVPATTRNWNTFVAIATALGSAPAAHPGVPAVRRGAAAARPDGPPSRRHPKLR